MKVGDYIRTKYGVIAKITDIIKDLSIDCDIDVYYEDNLKDKMPMMEIPYHLKDDYIIKSSARIIDLIQMGDYVNKCRVIDFMLENGKIVGVIVDADIWGFDADEIKSIVTKQQFESMEYNVE